MRAGFVVVALLIGVGLGFIFGKTQSQPEKNIEKSIDQPRRLNGISEQEIREYLRIQNADEKLKKADEILGKIVQALVADFGLRLEKAEIEQFGKDLPQSVNVAAVIESPTSTTLRPSQEKNDLSAEYLRLRRLAHRAVNEEEMKKVADQMPVDFVSRIQSAGSLSRQQISQLRGHFDGTLTYSKDNSQVRVTLDFNDQGFEGGKLMGTALIEIFDKNGKSISRGRSSGNLGRSYTGTPVSIFVETGGDYFELIYFPNLDEWAGNFMESQKGQLVKTGYAVFRKTI